MQNLLPLFITFFSGLVVGGGGVWFAARSHASDRQALKDQYADTFKALAADTLRQNNEMFLQLAESRLKQSEQAACATLDKKATAFDELVKPVKESLQKMDAQLQALEVKREGAYHQVLNAVQASNEMQQILRRDTGQLLQALHSSTTRGNWCQIQLKRIFEMAGMARHLQDFTSQQTFSGDDGILRPDYVVTMSGNRQVIFDCKAPMTAYIDFTKSDDDNTKRDLLTRHAKQLRDHIRALSAKEYWSRIDTTPEFVVLFLPENLLAAALDTDPEILDLAAKHKIVLATQTTVLAIMWSVAYGWKEEALRDNVKQIATLGGELYSAVAAMTEHVNNIGKKLGGALESYNSMIGSLERNVLSKARKLKESGASKDSKTLPESIEPIDLQPRMLTLGDDNAVSQEDAA